MAQLNYVCMFYPGDKFTSTVTRLLRWTICVCHGLMLITTSSVLAADAPSESPVPEYPNMGPDIFESSIDGESLVTGAVNRAAAEHKRVVLLLGANWCPWCRRLHSAISHAPAVKKILNERFVLAYVDVNTRHDKKRNVGTLERLGNPVDRFGLPAIVVLDADGKILTVQDTAPLAAPTDDEIGHRLFAFLQAWSGK